VSISVQINGEMRRVEIGQSVYALLAELGINQKKVAVERNREIVPKSLFENTIVEEGDQYEIVHFIGGG
jgi:thiamine biosynthesis protein ThiS